MSVRDLSIQRTTDNAWRWSFDPYKVETSAEDNLLQRIIMRIFSDPTAGPAILGIQTNNTVTASNLINTALITIQDAFLVEGISQIRLADDVTCKDNTLTMNILCVTTAGTTISGTTQIYIAGA